MRQMMSTIALAAGILYCLGGQAAVALQVTNTQAAQMRVAGQDAASALGASAGAAAATAALQDVRAACDPASVVLSESPQWEQEEGYWIGELSLFGADGNPSTSSSWNYRYDHYKGFITGSVQGNAYRQRNVFMYPPQVAAECPSSSPVGVGACGVNGNAKVFDADQTATTCSTNPELKGDIEGPYGSLSYTYTQLVGKNNSLLYQVFLTKAALNYYEGQVLKNPYGRCTQLSPYVWDCGYTEDRLMQSQLTTLTQLPDGTWRRTRTAQGFDGFAVVGSPSYASFYRERKVTEAEFWAEFNATQSEYNILDSDLCAWASGDTGGTVASGLTAGFAACKAHLEESFALPETPRPSSCLAGGDSHAVGDPHMQNIYGQRFDLKQPGTHSLVVVPRGSHEQDLLLSIRARADHLGDACSEMYFEVVNVTGEWAEAASPGGLHFDAGAGGDANSNGNLARWIQVGPVGLKVVRGHLRDGAVYLNLFLKRLRAAGYPVGGLLGEDSHDREASPPDRCMDTLSLSAKRRQLSGSSFDEKYDQPGSVATVTDART